MTTSTLTQVTETRETFFARLTPFFAPSDILDIQLAYTLAKFAHRAQTRSETDEAGKPLRYFEHVRRVAINLIDVARMPDKNMVIAALLHDGVEDTRDITFELIDHSFGADVARLVRTLTKEPKEGYLDRFSITTDWRPYAIKACDRLDNLQSLSSCTVEFQQKQVDETRTKYYPLFDRMVELTPTIWRAQSELLRAAIIAQTERSAGRLEGQWLMKANLS